MVPAGRPASLVDAARDRRGGEAELLDRHQPVMGIAEVAGVLVAVRSAVRQWDNVVDHLRLARSPLGQAHLAQAVAALEPPQTLRLAGAAAEADRSQAVTVPPCSARSRMNVSTGLLRPNPRARSLTPSVPASALLTAALSTLGLIRT